MSSPQQPADPPAAADSTAGGESTSDLLQSMLSRAVETQVGDQRELVNAVGDMRNQLMRMSQELAELRVRPADEGSDAQANTVTVELREAVRFLSERMDGVTRMVAQRGEEMADIRTALTAIDAHVRSQAETIGVLSAGLQALPSYGERVSVLQDNLQVLHRQLVGIEESVAKPAGDDKVGERLASIESAITPLGNRINEISDLGTAHSALLSQLQSSSAQLQQSVSGVSESVSGVSDSVAGVKDSVAGVHESVASVQSSVAGVHETVTNVHDRIEPLASDITASVGELAAATPAATPDLDAQISASVSSAVRDTEHRLMAHVDEAVMALAQTLLRRRPSATASQITGTPVAEAPEPEAVAPVEPEPVVVTPAERVEPEPIAVAPAEDTDSDTEADEYEDGDEDGDGVDPGVELDEADEDDVPVVHVPPVEIAEPAPTQWWERDIPASTPPPAVAEPAADATPDVDLAPVEAEPDAFAEIPSPDHWSTPDAPPVETPATPQIGVLDAEPGASPAAEDEPTSALSLGDLPPPAAETIVAPPTDAWTPQTPPERDPADPTVSFDDTTKKRRWGRSK